MSAYLDKSQGVTFVYSNIHELYRKAKDAKLDSPFVAERSHVVGGEQPRVLKAKDVKVEEFKPAELKSEERPFPVPMGVREAEEKAKRLNMRPVANLQKNLNDLTDAHEKLRFLLQELESLTKKKG
ncbi:MAG: hypothetical protein ACXVB9_11955 [Bdellovibrionota bacterium]